LATVSVAHIETMSRPHRTICGDQPMTSNSRRPFVGGNWKMNTTLGSAVELAEGVVDACRNAVDRVDVVLFPPFPYLQAVGRTLGHHAIAIGSQNFWPQRSGAFTGEVGLEMIQDLGLAWVLVGHSERRQHCGESDAVVADKVRAAAESSIGIVLCVGESLEQREAGDAEGVICGQVEAALSGLPESILGHLVIAYEPVWAIGTGRTATPDDAQTAHAAIRRTLAKGYHADFARSVRIIYGGSMNAGNAAGLLAQADVDGGLIGGASLQPESFAAICDAAAST